MLSLGWRREGVWRNVCEDLEGIWDSRDNETRMKRERGTTLLLLGKTVDRTKESKQDCFISSGKVFERKLGKVFVVG